MLSVKCLEFSKTHYQFKFQRDPVIIKQPICVHLQLNSL